MPLRVLLALCVALGSLALAAPAAAQAPQFGVAEDAAKYADDGGREYFGLMHELGMTENRITVQFDHTKPTVIQEEHGLDRIVRTAAAENIDLVFQVFPTSPRAFQGDLEGRSDSFASYVGLLARTYPSVDKFIVLNEPNEAYFQVPQFSSGANVSAGVAAKVLAKSYDALKAVDRRITVIGLGLSPEGNDRSSTSPVRFIGALGRAYRRSGRTAPLMDELGLHLYPLDAAVHDETTRYGWPNIGPSDLDRIKQAIWDAFEGTAQPVFQETPQAVGPVLRFALDEVGWQVEIPPSLAHLYAFNENTRVTTEMRQARVYEALIAKLGCDPTVGHVLLFHLRDEPDLRRFQSGLLRMDETRRPAFAAVAGAVRSVHACGVKTVWKHATTTQGASAEVPPRIKRNAAEFTVRPRAFEEVGVRIGVFRIRAGHVPSVEELARLVAAPRHAAAGRVSLTKTLVAALRRPPVTVTGLFRRGRYLVVVRFRPTMKPGRETLLVRRLRVG